MMRHNFIPRKKKSLVETLRQFSYPSDIMIECSRRNRYWIWLLYSNVRQIRIQWFIMHFHFIYYTWQKANIWTLKFQIGIFLWNMYCKIQFFTFFDKIQSSHVIWKRKEICHFWQGKEIAIHPLSHMIIFGKKMKMITIILFDDIIVFYEMRSLCFEGYPRK